VVGDGVYSGGEYRPSLKGDTSLLA
ncbi:MAG: hypothetical protein QOG25_3703, partial [Acetobacteraceae bacterium]|nr:hypothetical protein [Acetobacteraceae bacterium]